MEALESSLRAPHMDSDRIRAYFRRRRRVTRKNRSGRVANGDTDEMKIEE